MITIGVDPAKGWAVVDHRGSRCEVLDAGTVKGLEQMIEVLTVWFSRYKGCGVCVKIERPANKHVYTRPGTGPAAMKKIAVNVGENRARGEAIYYFCTGAGVDVEYVEPTRGMTKLSADQVERITGYKGKTSEHARDAIMIAWR